MVAPLDVCDNARGDGNRGCTWVENRTAPTRRTFSFVLRFSWSLFNDGINTCYIHIRVIFFFPLFFLTTILSLYSFLVRLTFFVFFIYHCHFSIYLSFFSRSLAHSHSPLSILFSHTDLISALFELSIK